jgi:hypothetical protein
MDMHPGKTVFTLTNEVVAWRGCSSGTASPTPVAVAAIDDAKRNAKNA